LPVSSHRGGSTNLRRGACLLAWDGRWMRGKRTPRRGMEVQVRTIQPTGGIAGWIVVAILGLAAPNGWAQGTQPPRPTPNPGPSRAPDALPGSAGRPDGNPRVGIVRPPTTPPSILAAEIRPIDLVSALRLANVQNPELNVA